MITIDTERSIRKSLQDGKTIAATARRFGVCFNTVKTIKKLPCIRERKAIEEKNKRGILVKLQESKRCEICGGKVFLWPCLLCHPQAGCY